MAFYLSPLVDVNEIDLTTTIPAVATSIAAQVLRFTYKGREKDTVLITSVDDLIETFGEPIDKIYDGSGDYASISENYRDMLSSVGYLLDGNKLYCTRVMPVSASFAGTTATSGSSGSCIFAKDTVNQAYTISDVEDPDMFHEYSNVVVPAANPFRLIAQSRGYWGNNIRVCVVDYDTYNAIRQRRVYCDDWPIYATVYQYIDSPLDDEKDFLIIVQAVDQGDDVVDTASRTTWKTVEVWNVSTNPNKTDDQGINKFCEGLINSNSNYIRIKLNPLMNNQTITISTSAWQQLGGGQDLDDADVYAVGTTITDAEIETAFDLYANAEEIDVNMFIDSDYSETVKKYLVETICTTRMDSIALISCKYSHVVNNKGDETDDLVDWRLGIGNSIITNMNTNSSYGALYGNWLEVYDKWNGKYRWIPATGYVAGIYARTDDVSDPWFAPAGLNRGIVPNARRLAWNPALGDRDILYKNGINPITSFAGQGKVVWGQKTLLDKESAFNRVNVRRLFMILEKAIATATKYFLFEPNDDITRTLLVNMIEPFLRDVKGRRGVYDYLVVCDKTNNTPERIDRNELWCDIYIKPTRAAEFIVLNFIATKTGASFTEVAALLNG